MATILLTGGRAPAALELARLFARAGHRVVVAESLAWPLTRTSRAVARHYRVAPPRQSPRVFVSALLDIVRRECVDLIVPTCEEVFHLSRWRHLLADQVTVFVAPFDQLRRLHSKHDFMLAVSGAGLPAPETVRVTDLADAVAHVARAPGELVLKPEYSRFATETVLRPQAASDLRGLDISAVRPWVAQRFVPGDPVCTYAVAHRGRVTAHAAYGVSFTAGPASAIHFVPCDDARVESWVRQFVAAESFKGQVAFDLVVTTDGAVMPIECNPRATSGVHLFGDQPALADTFLDPEASVLRPRPLAPRMLGVPMLIYGLRQALGSRQTGKFVRALWACRDVVFRWDDPMPTLLQPAAILELVALARRHGRGLLAASTADIEYNGEGLCESL